ncbi:hypothetical protein YB2330_005775 [Saitoella coloradoensis]
MQFANEYLALSEVKKDHLDAKYNRHRVSHKSQLPPVETWARQLGVSVGVIEFYIRMRVNVGRSDGRWQGKKVDPVEWKEQLRQAGASSATAHVPLTNAIANVEGGGSNLKKVRQRSSEIATTPNQRRPKPIESEPLAPSSSGRPQRANSRRNYADPLKASLDYDLAAPIAGSARTFATPTLQKRRLQLSEIETTPATSSSGRPQRNNSRKNYTDPLDASLEDDFEETPRPKKKAKTIDPTFPVSRGKKRGIERASAEGPGSTTEPNTTATTTIDLTASDPLSFPLEYEHLSKPRNFKLRDFCQTQPVAMSTDHKVLQEFTCGATRAKLPSDEKDGLGQCRACSVRQGDMCRFKGIRMFRQKADSKSITPEGWALTSRETPLLRNLGVRKRGEETREDISYALAQMSHSLYSVLQRELAHELNPHGHLTSSDTEGALRRPRDEGIRALCDACATTIFSGHCVCYVCGHEVCLGCWDEWDETSPSLVAPDAVSPTPPSTAGNGNQKAQVEVGNPMLDACRHRTRHGKHHFVPYTRFAEGEIRALMERASEWVALTQGAVWDNEIPQHLRVRGETEESLPFVSERWDNVSEGDFQKLWRRGEPLVLSGCLERMEIQWTPEYFIKYYGWQICHLVNCEKSQVIQATVEKFFENFENGELHGHRTLKLKDWPPKADFKTEFPALFEDFERALPFPRYTRRTGFFNIASRFPVAYLPPDLGPKMYNAYASSDEEGGAGTTNLHLDMTDAVNIMTYSAGNAPEGREGCAVWDIFPAEATGVLREFIKTEIIKEGKGVKGGEGVRDIDDPVLRQMFYLTRPHLALLRAKYGIRPHRIYQSPGDAVFIPAGCAHQVCNLTSCIKVACDFVSPENVSRCEVITRENRGLRERCKREDVLQLSNVVYFGWKDLEEGLVGAQLAGQDTPPVLAPEEGEQQTVQEDHEEKENRDEDGAVTLEDPAAEV